MCTGLLTDSNNVKDLVRACLLSEQAEWNNIVPYMDLAPKTLYQTSRYDPEHVQSKALRMLPEDFQRQFCAQAHELAMTQEALLQGVSDCCALVEENKKIDSLKHILHTLVCENFKSIIYCNSHLRVELHAKTITDHEFACPYIHGGMKFEERVKVFPNNSQEFRKGTLCQPSDDVPKEGVPGRPLSICLL